MRKGGERGFPVVAFRFLHCWRGGGGRARNSRTQLLLCGGRRNGEEAALPDFATEVKMANLSHQIKGLILCQLFKVLMPSSNLLRT